MNRLPRVGDVVSYESWARGGLSVSAFPGREPLPRSEGTTLHHNGPHEVVEVIGAAHPNDPHAVGFVANLRCLSGCPQEGKQRWILKVPLGCLGGDPYAPGIFERLALDEVRAERAA